MDRQRQDVPFRVIPWLLVVGAVAWCLSGVLSLRAELGWIFAALAILVLLESVLWQQSSRLKDSQSPEGFLQAPPIERMRFEAEQFSRETTWMLVALALVLASAFGVYLAKRIGPLSPAGSGPVVVQFSPELEQALENYLRNPPRPPGGPGAGPGIIGLDPDFQRQLLAALKQPPPTSTGVSWVIVAVIALFAICAGIGAGLLLSKHPEEAPIAAVTAFAGAIVAAAPHLTTLSGCLLWITVLSLIVGGISIGAIAAFRAPEEVKESLVVWSVSLCVLGAALACLPHFSHPERQEPVASTPKGAEILDISHLDPVTGFALGAKSLAGSRPLAGFAKQLRDHNAKPSDTLLLVGSADCTRVKPNVRETNDTIALGRANWVVTTLGPSEGLTTAALPHLQVQGLPQHSACSGTSDLRAVQAFLIQRKPAQAQPAP